MEVSGSIFWFAPFAAITEHSRWENSIQGLLARAGANVSVVRCVKDLRIRCTVNEYLGVGRTRIDQAAACALCTRERRRLETQPNLKNLSLSDLIPEGFESWAKQLIGATPTDDLLSFKIQGFPIGRYAAYETCIDHKVPTPLATRDSIEDLRSHMVSCAIALEAGKRLLDREQPDCVVTYSPEYGINRSFLAPFRQQGIPCYGVRHSGPLHDRFSSFTVDSSEFLTDALHSAQLPTAMERPLSEEEFGIYTSHIGTISDASDPLSYSPASTGLDRKSVRSYFGLTDADNCVLCLLSSSDEIDAMWAAALNPPNRRYISDDDIISQILGLAGSRQDMKFLVRLHPRMYPNRRDGRKSPLVDSILERLLSGSPNVLLNGPEDDLSIMDVAAAADVALTWRSSAGVIVASLGIPTAFLGEWSDPSHSTSASRFRAAPSDAQALSVLDKLTQDRHQLRDRADFARFPIRQIVAIHWRLGIPVRVPLQPGTGNGSRGKRIRKLLIRSRKLRNWIRILSRLAQDKNQAEVISFDPLKHAVDQDRASIQIPDLFDLWTTFTCLPQDQEDAYESETNLIMQHIQEWSEANNFR